MTGYIAYQAGFPAPVANAVAYHDQFVDVNPSTNPIRNWYNPGVLEQYHAFMPAFGSPSDVQGRRQELLGAAIVGAVQGNEQPIGTYFHFLQDSYSHADFYSFGGKGGVGHGLAGTGPDLPYMDQAKAMNMANATYNDMVFLSGLSGFTPRSNFEDISPTLSETFSISSENPMDRLPNDPSLWQVFPDLGSGAPSGFGSGVVDLGAAASQFESAPVDPVATGTVTPYTDPEFFP